MSVHNDRIYVAAMVETSQIREGISRAYTGKRTIMMWVVIGFRLSPGRGALGRLSFVYSSAISESIRNRYESGTRQIYSLET